MKQKFLKRSVAVWAAVCFLFSGMTASAETIEIVGSFGSEYVGKWLTAMAVTDGDTQAEPAPEHIRWITQERIEPDGSFRLRLPILQEEYDLRTNLPIENCYYVSDSSGSADGTGSMTAPVKTLQQAFALASDGDKIVLLDTIKISNWGTEKNLTVTGRNPVTGEVSGGIDLTGIISLRITGPAKLENMTLITKAAATIEEKANRIFACGNPLVMGEGLIMTEPIDILGGNSVNNTAESTDLTLLSGRYRRVYGGGWNSPVNGDTHIVIGGTVNSEYSVEDSSEDYFDSRVFGGGVYSGSEVEGNTFVTIKDNAAMAYVVGGGSGSGTDIKGGSTYISIEGGRVMNVYGGTVDKTTVYAGNTYINMTGGSVEGIFGGSMSQTMTGNTFISILGGQVTRRVFGGCYNDWTGSWKSDYHVVGTTAVWIGGDARMITGEGLTSDNRDNSGIFAASRAKNNVATETSYLIFADGTYNAWKGKIGDVSGWSSTFKPYNDYLVKAGVGGTAVLSQGVPGALTLKAEQGKTAFCNGKRFGNGVYAITKAETVIEFSQEMTLSQESAELTETGAEVSADVEIGALSGGECLLAAVYDERGCMISVRKSEITETGNYRLRLDFEPKPSERYIVKLFVWSLSELTPISQCYVFGPLGK